MVKYVRADSVALIQSLKHQLALAKAVTEQLKAGSHQLIQAVNGEQLSGAAYTAGQGLFRNLIVPTIERVAAAVTAIEEELVRYQSADAAVSRWAVLDEVIQKNLIQALEQQIQVIEHQLQQSRQLGFIGKLSKGALEALFYQNRRMEQVKNEAINNRRKEQEKLDALLTFQAQTQALFQDSLQQLKIARQVVDVLALTTVNPKTGAYQLPAGFDASWFTARQSVSVKEARQRAALAKGMADLQLPKEAQKYYQKIMKKALKNVPIDQWDAAIKELNQLLLFDDEGNILRVLPVNMGAGNGVILLKNGVNDPALTRQANQEMNAQQLELVKQSLSELGLGVMTALSGLGITGLDLAGTYFSGGTLALTGMSQAGTHDIFMDWYKTIKKEVEGEAK